MTKLRTTTTHLVEELGILRNDEADISKRLGAEADSRGVRSIDDVVEQRLVEGGERAGAGELEGDSVDRRLLVLSAVAERYVSDVL